MEQTDARRGGPYRLSVAERAGVERGLRELRERHFANDEAVAAVFRRARNPGACWFAPISPHRGRSGTVPSMNSLAVKRMSVAEFLVWAQDQDKGRFELIDGQPIAMPPERAEHVEAKLNAANALTAAIRRAGIPCKAYVEGLAVVVDGTTSYLPDALVNCGEPVARDAMIAPLPVIVVEVLSPSTRGIDTTVKLAGYFRVASLAHYLIVDLGQRHVVHYRKQADGTVTVVVVADGDIALDPPGISVEVSSLLG
jgi:Uma2 family endonuclease